MRLTPWCRSKILQGEADSLSLRTLASIRCQCAMIIPFRFRECVVGLTWGDRHDPDLHRQGVSISAIARRWGSTSYPPFASIRCLIANHRSSTQVLVIRG